jgi:hypothetical protein
MLLRRTPEHGWDLVAPYSAPVSRPPRLGLLFCLGSGKERPGTRQVEVFRMLSQIRTMRVHRTWFDKLKLWSRAYETKISDGSREVCGRGPTPEASQGAAEWRWANWVEPDAQ